MIQSWRRTLKQRKIRGMISIDATFVQRHKFGDQETNDKTDAKIFQNHSKRMNS